MKKMVFLEMKTILLVVIFLFTISFIYAQKTGSVSGIIKDTHGKLPGVTLVVKNTLNGSTTDASGKFQLSNVPVGKQTLTLSFIGYESKEIEVEVKEARNVDLGVIDMVESSIVLDEVVINGTFFPSQARALNIKKTAPGIMDVLAADAIGKLPDRNAAEAVQRISGVSIERDHGEGRYVIVRGTPLAWNSTLLNGNRMPSSEGTSNDAGGRTSPLDIFPSEMIEYVFVSKAITPDMEGDAIGGSVNFVTKTAPVKRTLKLNVGYGHNAQAEKPIEGVSLLYGDRLFNDKFGFLVSGSYWNRNWGTDNYEVEYAEEDFAIQKIELRDYLGKRTTYGINIGLEYNLNDNNKIFARGIYTDFQDDETAVEHIFGIADEEFTFRQRRGILGITLKGFELGGHFALLENKLNIDWKLSDNTVEFGARHLPNTTRTSEPVYQMVMWTKPMTYSGLASNGKKYLDIDAPASYTGDHFNNIQPNPTGSLDPSTLALDMLYGFQIASLEEDLNAQLDLMYDLNENVKLKAGYKFKKKYLERGAPAFIDVNIPAYGLGVHLNMAELNSTGFPHNGGYLTEINEPYNDLLQDPITFEELDKLFGDDFQKNPFYEITNDVDNPSSAPGFFDGYETVNAAYGMTQVNLNDQFTLIVGARYEHTGIEYDGHSVITTKDAEGKSVKTIVKVNNSSDFGAFLPMAHLKYSPMENVNFRFAYTRTYARANFSDLNPTVSRNDIFKMINQGNINLKPTFSNNFDLMGEYFFQNLGLVSFSVFYKSLSNVIYNTRSIVDYNGERYELYQPENSENGMLAGFEIGISRRLTKLPGFLSGFGVEFNYTYTKSEMDVPKYSIDDLGNVTKTTTKEALPNQSKNIFNVGLFYEKNKLSVRVAGNYKGAALAVVQGNPENYRWYDKNFTLDLTASYNITNKIKLYIEINNLTNEPLRYYQGSSERPEQTEYYSLRGMLGLNVSLF